MIIVSQDKVANINYNNIEATYLLKKDDEVEINVRGNYDYTIGKYKTEERAKEVLQEIVRLYRRCQQVIGERGGITNFIYPPKVYEMPKE